MDISKDGIIVSIVTSFLAAVVFWIVFDLIPMLIKYFRIRPRLEKDIIDIELHLFFFIQIPFLQSVYTASFFQSEIEEKDFSQEDFKNALYGKCLSKESCVNEFEHRLLAVGEKLKFCADEFDKRFDRIQRYADYLKTNELLLLKDISEKIHTYGFAEHTTVVDGVPLVSVNPSISYMSRNFYELYILYHELKSLSDSFLLVKRNAFERYRITERELKNRRYVSYYTKRLFLEKKQRDLIDIRYYYLKGEKRKIKEKLIKYLQLDTQKLVYIRGGLDYLMSDSECFKACIAVRGESEVKELMDYLNAERSKKNRFLLRNLETKKMIEERIKNTPIISELDEKKINIIRKVFDGYV